MRKRIAASAVMLLWILGWMAFGGKLTASAAVEPSADTFSGNVAMLKQEGNYYVMQVTVENRGEDFSGTVQAVFASSTFANCAYNTEITLPAQGKKQFTINVTNRAADTVRGVCALNFLDEKGNLLQTISLKNVFGSTASGIQMGILSDNYSGLTFLDAGGKDFAIQGTPYPLKLVELTQENLESSLGGLYFLVIDQFNVSSLGEENILAIQDWVKKGGWLIIGTGAYAEQTLSGFEEDFIGAEVLRVSEPGEQNTATDKANRYEYYYQYTNAGVDFARMAIADLDYNKMSWNFEEDVEHPAFTGAVEDGAVSVLLFSLGEEELRKLDDYVIQSIYENVMYRSESYYNYGADMEMEGMGKRALAFIDNTSANVDFTWLEVLIGVYVVLIGPILYLILRRCRKSEWYWVCVPALGLVFIGGVFLFGQGAKVNGIRVYSVTAQRADSSHIDTYFLAYRSGIKEWNILLDDRYETAGPGLDGYYRSYGGNANDYYYAVSSGSDGLSVGIKPQMNFDNGFLYAGGTAQSRGNLLGRDITVSAASGEIGGTVVNDTDCDLDYMAVWLDEPYACIMVVSDVKGGETIDLQQAVKDGRCVYQNSYSYYNQLLRHMLGIYGRGSNSYQEEDMAALLVGLGAAAEGSQSGAQRAVIAGVVKDYEKAAAGRYNETSYGCLYSYAELEVEDNAAN